MFVGFLGAGSFIRELLTLFCKLFRKIFRRIFVELFKKSEMGKFIKLMAPKTLQFPHQWNKCKFLQQRVTIAIDRSCKSSMSYDCMRFYICFQMSEITLEKNSESSRITDEWRYSGVTDEPRDEIKNMINFTFGYLNNILCKYFWEMEKMINRFAKPCLNNNNDFHISFWTLHNFLNK